MADTAAGGLEVIALSQALGAEVRGVDASRPLPDSVVRAIRAAWLEHLVIVLREQRIDEGAQLRFATYFGPVCGLRDPYESGRLFQSDECWREQPAMATLLHAAEPAAGAATRFANGYRAYQALSEALRQRLAGRRAMHLFVGPPGAVFGDGRPDAEELAFAHPVVRTHPETHRKSLYVNRSMTHHIEGLDIDESHEVLRGLFSTLERPEFVYEHRWQPGDLVLWDNRCTVHAGTGQGGAMWRLRLAGDRPR